MNIDDEKISRLYHQADTPDPPGELDEAILSAAHKAAEKPAHEAPFSGMWPAAASMAAVIIIAVILVPLLTQEESLQEMEQASSASSRSTEDIGQVPSSLYSTIHTGGEEKAMPTPASEPVERRQQDLVAKEPPMPVTAMSGSAALRTNADKRSPLSADDSSQPVAGIGDTTRSRMEAGDSAPFAALTPEMWEVRINRLIEGNEIEQARIELEKLQRHFPRHKVSRTILEKLRP